jgi:hypothetical protein
MRWEQVPILGNNPVFCFEARSIWRRDRAAWLVLIVLGVGLLGWAFHLVALPPLGGLQSLQNRSRLWSAAAEAFPPAAPLQHWPGFLLGRASLNWQHAGGYLLMATLLSSLCAAVRYVVPALAALSLAGDRAAGRLARLLAGRLRPGDILLGKMLALAGPICLLLVLVVGTTGPLALMGGTPLPMVSLPASTALAALFVGTLLGLRVGLSVRRPAAAAGVSILAAGIVLPIVSSWIAHTVDLPILRLLLRLETSMPAPVDPWRAHWAVIGLTNLAVHGLAFAALWFSTKRAIARAAE